jgi:hypothetical protein
MKRSSNQSPDQYSDDPSTQESPKGRSSYKIFSLLGIGAFLLIGSTFAANINLNSGQNVEFGQGILVATSCDSEITLTPFSTFINTSGSGAFYFSGFTLSNIDTPACNDRSFSLSAYENSSSSPIALFDTKTVAVINDSGTAFVVAPGQSGFSISDTSTVGAFTAVFTTPVALASSVFKLTLQSSNIVGQTVSGISYNRSFDATPHYQINGFGGYAVIHSDGHVCGVIVSASNDPFNNGGVMTNEYMGCPSGSVLVLQTKPQPSGNVYGWHGLDVTYSAGVFTIPGGTTIYRGIATDLSGRIWDTGSGLTLNLA